MIMVSNQFLCILFGNWRFHLGFRFFGSSYPKISFWLKIISPRGGGMRRIYITCIFCSELESMNNLFFDCCFSKGLWVVNSHDWKSWSEWCLILWICVFQSSLWIANKKHLLTNPVFVAALWCLWKLRNKICFQGLFGQDWRCWCFGSPRRWGDARYYSLEPQRRRWSESFTRWSWKLPSHQKSIAINQDYQYWDLSLRSRPIVVWFSWVLESVLYETCDVWTWRPVGLCYFAGAPIRLCCNVLLTLYHQ